MKTLKKSLIVLLILVAIPLLVALFVPKEFKSEREVIIDRPVSEVFDYVKYVKNQDSFGVWQLSDPEAKMAEEGVDGTVGYKYSWDGKKVGKGTQTITKVVEHEKLETELDFGFGNPSKSYILTKEVNPNQTKVVWGMTGKTPYPWNLMGLFYDMGEDFEKGLQNLKEVLESQEVKEGQAALQSYYGQTLDNLRKSVSGLSEAQLHFKPASGKWSIMECVEHIVVSEPMIFEWLKNGLEQPANPENRAEIQVEDEDIEKMVTNREYKAKATGEMLPAGRYSEIETALNDLQTHQQTILKTLSMYSMEDLRNHVLDLPTGKADAYQFALFIAGHAARHTLQIEEVKAHPDFPKE